MFTQKKFILFGLFLILVLVTSREKKPDVSYWIQKFCRQSGNEFYVEVPNSFVTDSLVLQWIKSYDSEPMFKDSLQLLSSTTSATTPYIYSEESSPLQIATSRLYNRLHSRYILSQDGLKKIRMKHLRGDYGSCPRVFCENAPLIPVGLHDELGMSEVKGFCPRCRDVYHYSDHITCDGGGFGTTLPHLLLHSFPELSLCFNPNHKYVPRIFGFKINANATELRMNRGERVDEVVDSPNEG
jgi:casein kinase II subunit beta